MKNLCCLFFSLFSLCISAQQKNNHKIKIFLEDAETGKNIDDAKVTLEGFEIPPIIGLYDKKGKFYYFDEIPNGYNTIMAYHKKYNEKGYQNLKRLPGELKLRLYDPNYVSYSFEKIVLTKDNCCNQGKKYNYQLEPQTLKRVKNSSTKKSKSTFRYLYVEDPYHIAIISKLDRDHFLNDDKIKESIKNLSIEEMYKSEQFGQYDYESYAIDNETGHLVDGFDALTRQHTYKVYIFQKKDGTRFKRFNCPEIKELREINLIVSALTIKKLEYYANKPFNSENFYGNNKNEGDVKHYQLSTFRNIDISYFDTQKEDFSYYFFGINPNATNDRLTSLDDDKIFSAFFVIPKDFQSSIGLGALDNVEIDKTNDSLLFTNTYKN
jgi:hypothetical protein